MAFFLILAEDRPDGLKERLEHRAEHIEYWSKTPGAVKVAGAMLDQDTPCGSAFLLEARDEAEARAMLAGDPFTQRGVFSGEPRVVAVRPAIGEWLPTK